jgi:hypothetical protein
VQKSRESAIRNRPRFCSILSKFLHFENALTFEEVHRGCHNVLGGHDIVKK